MAHVGSSGSGSTLAFESIDGPPPEVFRKLVANLNDEAGARKIAVVSRSSPATYRVRGYVSALVERNKTTFSWVWDIYDTDKRRTLRIAGEEPAKASSRRGAWAAADETVLRHIARDGMDRIAAFLNSPASPTAAPESSLVTLVSGRDDTPEAAGIFRIFGDMRPQPASAAAEPVTENPLPPRAPNAGNTRAETTAKAKPAAKTAAKTTPRATAKTTAGTTPKTTPKTAGTIAEAPPQTVSLAGGDGLSSR